ncbi:MAG: D-tyrosyl-tRNA(Tyr) deacylase [Bacteroidetes bacterium]|nr:D-tyrosyl-tRNA(Tyr) deacylase [Bacteroidota bacterium]
MRAVIQRVRESTVTISGQATASIGDGILVLAGFVNDDTNEDLEWVAGKVSRLRIFDDAEGVMNLPVSETGGEVLIISQFTLHARIKKGNRPSYIEAAGPESAVPLYETFIGKMESLLPGKIRTGVFGAEMMVSLINDGPVTIIIDSKNRE